MESNQKSKKAVVHISGKLLRQVWWSKERNNCILVRPAGAEGQKVAYVVNQVYFDGPSKMVYGVKPRTKPRDANDICAPDKSLIGTKKSIEGHIGTLEGFDNTILVYLEADESSIHVQANEGDEFIPFVEFRKAFLAKKIIVPTLNPKIDLNC